jgi:pimeloyl-ACP methyl ester carboxylesterase
MFSTHELQVGGARLAYREAGEGPVLLFLHGSGGAESALPCLALLTDRYRVLVPDLPGFGSSDPPAWLHEVADLGYACLTFMRGLGLREVHLVGASFGGWVALEAAIRDESRLRCLTLIAAAGINPGDVTIGDLFRWDEDERVRQLVASPEFARRLLALRMTPAQRERAARNDATARRLCRETRFHSASLERWLHRIDVPTTVIWGDTDRLLPIEYGRKLAAQIPGSRLVTIADCGHLPAIEHPERLAELLAR